VLLPCWAWKKQGVFYHYLTHCPLRACLSSAPLKIKLIQFGAATDVKEDSDKQSDMIWHRQDYVVSLVSITWLV
jgi:hypothetical protein